MSPFVFYTFLTKQVLIETIRKYWNSLHVLDILTKVNECIADKQRTSGVKVVHVPYVNHTLRCEMHLGKLESLIDYINEKGILTDRQYICGFRSKRSTNHAIIELVDEITKAIEKKKLNSQ